MVVHDGDRGHARALLLVQKHVESSYPLVCEAFLAACLWSFEGEPGEKGATIIGSEGHGCHAGTPPPAGGQALYLSLRDPNCQLERTAPTLLHTAE